MGEMIKVIKQTIWEWRRFRKNICAMCGKKITDPKDRYVAMSSWNVIHGKCLDNAGKS